jgi:hypothetical protein
VSDRRTIELLHQTRTGLDSPGGNFTMIRTVRTETYDAFGNTRSSHTLRLTARVDVSYPVQSVYRADRWDGARWQEVASIEGADTDWAPPRGRRIDKREFAEDLCVELQRRAVAVLS